MNRLTLTLASLTLGLAVTAAWAQQYDFAAEAEELAVPGETVQQAGTATARALQASPMKLTISTVGFDIAPGSDAEKALKETAQIGGGGYFTAQDSGQLINALGAAASGQTAAGVAGGITLQQPREGDTAGPSIDVIGSAGIGEVVVVFTEVYDAQTGEKLRMVPGIRHRTDEKGNFTFRVATPRVSFGAGQTPPPLSYQVHVYVVREDGSKGPETIVKLRGPNP